MTLERTTCEAASLGSFSGHPSALVFPDCDTLDFNIKRAGPYRDTEENAGGRILGKVAFVS